MEVFRRIPGRGGKTAKTTLSENHRESGDPGHTKVTASKSLVTGKFTRCPRRGRKGATEMGCSFFLHRNNTISSDFYCSPAAVLLPHIADDPHIAEEPHIALPAQTVLNPSEVVDPHIAEEPHMADEPHIADDPHMAEVDPTNCEEPQTVPLPHIAEEFQTAV
jgi:hypothetical protein